jgi:predicted secreted protein
MGFLDMSTRRLQGAYRLGVAVIAVLSAAACSSQSRTGSPQRAPAPPEIQSVESASNPVHPGDSTALAVVATREGESTSVDAGRGTRTQQGALEHDASTDATDRSSSTDTSDASSSTDTEAIFDARSSRSDADPPPSNGRDASGGRDAASEPADTDSGGEPTPPNGRVPEGWSVEWSVAGDGWSITGEGATAELTAADRYQSEATVTVTVTDDRDRSDTAELTIGTGSNTPPAIVNATARPNPVSPDSTVEASVEASDPNGDELTYQWRIGEPWDVTSTSGGEATIRAPDRDGVFADLRIEVRDGYGGTTSSSIRLETRTNQTPIIASVTATPPQVEPEGTTTLQVEATDTNDDALTYRWNVPSTWSASSTSGTEIEVTAPDSYGASGSVEVVVEDERGATARGRVTVSTTTNDGPSIASLDATPKSVAKGGTIDLEVTASDPNDDPLSYNWSVQDSQNWNLSSQGSGATLQAPDQPGQSTNVEVTVTDESGASARASIVVSTRANTAPSIASVSATPTTLEPGGSGQVTVSAADPDGDSLSYQWSATGSWSVSGSGESVTVQAPSSYGQSGAVQVTVSDGFGGQASGQAAVSTAANQAPTLSALTANPQTLAPQGTSTIEATASDPNGDSLSYNWQIPSGWSQSGSGAQIQVTAPGNYGQQGLVRVTVNDGNGGQTQGAVLVETDRNQSPTIGGVTANPVVVQPGGTTTITTSATDPNGDSLSYSWSVPQGWTQQGSGSTIDVVAPNQTNASATMTVTVSDGNGGQSKSATVVQTIQNRPPTIDSLQAQPSKVAPKGQTTLTVSARDPEGDALTYTWSAPSGWSKSGSGDQITLTAPNRYADSGTVRVTVSDQKAQTSKQVSVETVANQAPTVDDLSASPNPVLQNGESTLEVQASDQYGDSLSYRWNVGGNWSINGSGAKVTLQAPNDGNTSTSVTVTVDDGRGLTTSSSITVQTQACPSNQGNCDGNAGNGCEVDLTSNESNCGSCGNTCTAPKDSCMQSTCRQIPIANCNKLVTNRNAWGQNAKGIDLRDWTNSTLHYIGCNGNGCQRNEFYCRYDANAETLEFGASGTVRAAPDPGDKQGDQWPTGAYYNGCCNSALGLCNGPDSSNNGVNVDNADALCRALGYRQGELVAESNGNSCPEVHVTNNGGTSWTSDYGDSGGYGRAWKCTGFR